MTILAAALSIFSFFTANLIFGVIFALLTVIFVVGIIFSKSKAVDYSTAISQEINDLENQLTQLEKEYNLDFDLEHQQRVREQWRHAKKNKKILEEKHQYINQSLTTANERLDSLKNSIIEIKKSYIYQKNFQMN